MLSELLNVHMEELGEEEFSIGNMRYRAMLFSSCAETIENVLQQNIWFGTVDTFGLTVQ